MSLPILTRARVLSKSTKEGTGKDGSPKIYFNVKLADTSTFDSQIVGVNEEVYNSIEEGQDVLLGGKCGGLKEKYWYFNSLVKPEDVKLID